MTRERTVRFSGLDILVDEGIYVPTRETEELVRYAVQLIESERYTRIVDVGTGSGAIALAIQHQLLRKGVRVTGTDIHEIELAKQNARKLNLPVNFQQGIYVDNLEIQEPELIVANLPYGSLDYLLESNKGKTLDPEKCFHPDGILNSYVELLASIRRRDWTPRVLMEVGPIPEKEVREILGEHNPSFIVQRNPTYGIVDINLGAT